MKYGFALLGMATLFYWLWSVGQTHEEPHYKQLLYEHNQLRQFAGCVYSFGVLGPKQTGTKLPVDDVVTSCAVAKTIHFEHTAEYSFKVEVLEGK